MMGSRARIIRGGAWLAGLGLLLSACGVAHATADAGSGQPAGCRVTRGVMPGTGAFPGFTRYVDYPRMRFPGSQSVRRGPVTLKQSYVCGAVAGFLTDVSLTGRYRAQNNAQARKLGYQVGRWPATPLSGSIVGQQRHRALEIYLSVFQFTSARAAAQYAHPDQAPAAATQGLGSTLQPRTLAAGIPGAVVTQLPEGTNPGTSETAITLRVPDGTFAITLAIGGGESFSWPDFRPYWRQVQTFLTPLEGNAS